MKKIEVAATIMNINTISSKVNRQIYEAFDYFEEVTGKIAAQVIHKATFYPSFRVQNVKDTWISYSRTEV